MVRHMAGRRDDSTPDRPAGSAVRRVERPSRSRAGRLRTAGLVAGLLLAVGATVAVFFTDDALYLRVALLAACWAFLVAAFLAGGRRVDQVAAAGREAELRHAYEVELEREVAARHEYERDLADELRREAEEGMRQELADLRGEIAALGGLRGDLAELGELRGELRALGQLRAELIGLGELRSELGQLRGELTEQLSGELLIERMVMRAQSVRVPADRAGDDRVVDGRAGDGRVLDADRWRASWEDDRVAGRGLPAADARPVPSSPGPPPEPTLRLQRLDDASPATGLLPKSPIEWLADRAFLEPPSSPDRSEAGDDQVRLIAYPPKSPIEWLAARSLVDEDALTPAPPAEPEPEPGPEPQPEPQRLRQVAPPPLPAQRPNRHRVGLDGGPSALATGEPRRHRRAAEPDDAPWPAPAVAHPVPAADHPAPVEVPSWPAEEIPAWAREEPSWKRAELSPAPQETPSWLTGEPSWTRAATPSWAYPDTSPAHDEDAAAVHLEPEDAGHARLAEILAESAVSAQPGGRRRRRHRDDDEAQPVDDVLARVLGRQ
jgi:hypothetical protein